MRDIRDDHDGDMPPTADILAGEYVLGVLSRQERAEVARRIDSDPAFARLVQDWEQRIAPLLEEFGTSTVTPHLWPRIRTSLGWPAVAPRRAPLLRGPRFWQGMTAIAAGVALLAWLPGRDALLPAPPASVATTPAGEGATRPVTPLLHDDGSPGWLASVDHEHGEVLMVPVPSAADAGGRVPELWLIAADGKPRSLGLVSNARAHTVQVPAALRAALVRGAVLAITLEPATGAPAGVPTGPVVAKGMIASL